jgi:hypothetical protein
VEHFAIGQVYNLVIGQVADCGANSEPLRTLKRAESTEGAGRSRLSALTAISDDLRRAAVLAVLAARTVPLCRVARAVLQYTATRSLQVTMRNTHYWRT